MITPAQIRAARALLGWHQSDVARAAGVSLNTLNNLERGVVDARSSTVNAVQGALERAGIEFIAEGVRRRPTTPSTQDNAS